MVDARLPDGSRVNAVIPPLSLSGPAADDPQVHRSERLDLDDLVRLGRSRRRRSTSCASACAAELNILVSGGTGSGKTTLLNAMSRAIPDDDRIVTIEDAAELRLNQRHVLRLEARPANIEGEGEVAIRDLVRNALRMRPDRIIVGEVRGAEALDMLQAMNTGHDGSLSTVHANSPRDALARIETMVLMAGYDLPMRAIRQQVASALDLIVHVERLPDGSRRVTAITEVSAWRATSSPRRSCSRSMSTRSARRHRVGRPPRDGPAPDVRREARAPGPRAARERWPAPRHEAPARVAKTGCDEPPDDRHARRRWRRSLGGAAPHAAGDAELSEVAGQRVPGARASS